MNYKYSQFKHGQKCTCTIDGVKITDAKISIDDDGRVYICQNEKDGESADDKLGYKYSLLVLCDYEDFEEGDFNVTDFILKGVSKMKLKYAVKYELDEDPTEYFGTKNEAMEFIEEKIDEGATDIYLIELGKVLKVKKTGFTLEEVK